MTRRSLLSVSILFLLFGCAGTAEKKAPFPMESAASRAYPHFSDDIWYDGLAHAIEKSLAYYHRVDPNRSYLFGPDSYPASHLIRSLETFSEFVRSRPSTASLNRFIKDHYRIYQSVGKDKPRNVLFTGYYEPILSGSLERKDPFVYPIYPKPDDLVTVDLGLFDEKWKGKTLVGRQENSRITPYPDRKAIDVDKQLEGKTDPLVWLKDPVDAFFLQIQGSGKVYLDGSDPLNVHYHTSNGRPYRSIGKLLIDTHKIDRSKMSMQSIRAYLESHPNELQEILNYNPSYVFFKTETEGPKGSLDVVLTPGRSIALDHRLFPHGALGFIETRKPVVDADGNITKWIRFNRFVVHQDTGGAIRGPDRADLFWGNGPFAEIAAGHMRHEGTLYFLVLKPGS